MQTPAYVRVINSQALPRDILLDKIARWSGNFENGLSYAQEPEFQVYVPYTNPIDPTVPGYVDLPPSDEVRLQSQLPHGVITQLAAKGYVSFFTHAGGLSAGPSITGAVHNSPVGDTTISGPVSGATFLSLTPDHTYVILTNLSGSKQTIKDTTITGGGGTISATSIVLPNTLVTGGPVVAGWMVQVQSNSKLSNVFTVT